MYNNKYDVGFKKMNIQFSNFKAFWTSRVQCFLEAVIKIAALQYKKVKLIRDWESFGSSFWALYASIESKSAFASVGPSIDSTISFKSEVDRNISSQSDPWAASCH